jgi:hypothetical protein
LTEIELIDRTFTGHYQGDKYRYEWERDDRVVSEPVTLQRVRALMTEPSPRTEVPPGELVIRGVAWSGAAPIARVEVSANGSAWQEARLVSERNRYSWQWWELITRVEKSDHLVIRARATDLAGRTQPERVVIDSRPMRIYLNFKASTPVASEVVARMQAVLNEPFGNRRAITGRGSPRGMRRIRTWRPAHPFLN